MTKTSKQSTESSQLLEADQIANYLKSNPGFLEGRDDLLLRLEIPHQRGSSVSLVERQVTLLRENNIDMRRRLNELVSAAKSNDVTFERTRDLVLALMDAATPDEFFNSLEKILQQDFMCNSARLIIVGNDPTEISQWVSIIPQVTLSKNIPGLVKNNRPVLGVLRPEEQDYIFGDASSKIKSTAIVPIKSDQIDALLAIGNKDPEYFQARMGTLFLNFIADVLARLIPTQIG